MAQPFQNDSYCYSILLFYGGNGRVKRIVDFYVWACHPCTWTSHLSCYSFYFHKCGWVFRNLNFTVILCNIMIIRYLWSCGWHNYGGKSEYPKIFAISFLSKKSILYLRFHCIKHVPTAVRFILTEFEIQFFRWAFAYVVRYYF